MNESIDSDLLQGSAPPSRSFGPITRTDIVRYQGASGDFHPAHHDDQYAQRYGYPTAFSLGMLAAGYLMTFAVDWLGPANLRHFRVRFENITWPGDHLVCSGHVLSIQKDEGHRVAHLELACHRNGGELAVRGWATFQLPPVGEGVKR